MTTFRPKDAGWREPYERDVNGQLIDEVVDWAGMEFDLLKQDKITGMLMVLAAEAIKSGKRTPEYWQVERRWMAGESAQIIQESLGKVKVQGAGSAPAPAPVNVSAAPSVAAAPAALSWDVPTWEVGDEWTFRWESPRGKGTFVWSVDRIERVDGNEFYVVKAGNRLMYRRKADLAIYMEIVDGQVEIRHVGLSRVFPWPLVPGKAIEYDVTIERPLARQTVEVTRACSVVREETVTVPAGEFQTAKIACKDRRTDTVVHELWYAPRVKQWVRERSLFSYGWQERELISSAERTGSSARPSAK